MHITLAQAVAWLATIGGVWALVRAGGTKGVLEAKAPARCAACGRRKVWNRCPCTDDSSSLR